MSSIIRTNWDESTNKDIFKNSVYEWFNLSKRPRLVEYPNVVIEKKSSDEYERLGRYAGLDYAGEVPEGQGVPIQDPKFGSTKDYTHKAYGTGFRITERMKMFEKIGLFRDLTENLRVVMDESKDVEIAKMFNNMTSTTYASGFDGLAIAHNSHTCLDDAGTTYDNYLDAGLSTSSWESAMAYFDYLYDDQGNIWTVVPDTLVVNRTLRWDAEELLKSSGKPWEESNTINPYKGDVKPFVYHRLTSSTAWFVIAKNHPKYGYFVFTAKEPDLKVYDALDTSRDTVVTSNQYFVYGVSDPRLLYVGDT